MFLSNTLVCLLSASMILLTSVNGLDCKTDEIKVYVKLSEPSQFNDAEQYLFRSLTAYSVQYHCTTTPGACASGEESTDVNDVNITPPTPRVSFCMKVNTADVHLVRSAINGSLDRFYGGMQLTSDVLQIDGVDPIIEEAADPDFPTWLIPFIVIAALIVLAALAMVFFTYRSSKKQPDDEEKESLTENDAEVGHRGVYENDDEQRTEL